MVDDTTQAQYIIQTNTIYCNTERQMITMETMVSGGYGSSIGGAISSFGGAVGSIGGMAGMANPMIGMGASGISAATSVIGGAVDSISGLFSSHEPKIKEEDVTYACVTDVQITERGPPRDSCPPAT